MPSHFHRPFTAIVLAVATVCAQAQEARYDIDIPAQPLGQSLGALSSLTGLQPFYAEQAAKGATTNAVKGSLTLREALGRLLAGTGLTFEFTGEKPVAIRAAQATATAPTQLPAMEIRASAITPPPPPSVSERNTYLRKQASIATKTDTPVMQTATKVEGLTQQAIRDLGLGSQGMGQAMATLGVAGLGMGDLGDVYFFRGFQTTTTLWNGFRIEDIGSAATNGVNGGVWMSNVDRM